MTTVYRCFNAEHELLYVGLSEMPDNRIKQHQFSSKWFSEVAYTEREECATREKAFEVEAQAIEKESPKYNKRGGQKPVALPSGTPKTAVMNVRLKPHVKKAIVAAAKKERRSIANMVELLIMKHCEENPGADR